MVKEESDAKIFFGYGLSGLFLIILGIIFLLAGMVKANALFLLGLVLIFTGEFLRFKYKTRRKRTIKVV